MELHTERRVPGGRSSRPCSARPCIGENNCPRERAVSCSPLLPRFPPCPIRIHPDALAGKREHTSTEHERHACTLSFVGVTRLFLRTASRCRENPDNRADASANALATDLVAEKARAVPRQAVERGMRDAIADRLMPVATRCRVLSRACLDQSSVSRHRRDDANLRAAECRSCRSACLSWRLGHGE